MPDELDPQVREFASQLRRLVDRGGLSIAAVADRTGYSKTSWERYLNGRLLAPKGAIVALAEVTGTNTVHLTTMWELAERAWSRSEMRHDRTMEAVRISQARAALGEFGPPPANAEGGRTARKGGSATVTPGIAGPAGVSPTVPLQPTAPEVQDAVGSGSGTGHVGSRGATAGYAGATSMSSSPPSPPSPSPSASAPPPPSSPGGRRRWVAFLVGVVGALAVLGGVLFLMDGGGQKQDQVAAGSSAPPVGAKRDLPAGVRCSGAACEGKDAESMGCSGERVATTRTVSVGATVVEVRYSATCGAAWGRITRAAPGDEVRVTVGRTVRRGNIAVAGDTIAYTPMVAVKNAGQATVCATLASGKKGCTR
ncbi:helix-turn-helix domain-containing protein [Streptomyces sp. NPDC087903]|uniref:helix-turn-helix domain-containing protein n=1 Tax=Streptomyces sp. NPDC087903 TaxID=3365819 RepID=UPI00381912D9